MMQANPFCFTSKAGSRQSALNQLALRRSHKLTAWFATLKGQQILALQKKLAAPILSRCFGHYAFQVSPVADAWSQAFPALSCQWLMRFVEAAQPTNLSTVQSTAHALPFANNSINAVLLHHTLDLHAAPHALLRELERVLTPGGRMAIIGWHPWGLWGSSSALLRSSMSGLPVKWQYWPDRYLPWDNCFLSPHRLRDWLELLGFDVEVEQVVSLNPWLAALKWPLLHRYFGAFYIMSGVKRSDCLTPIRPGWSFSTGQFASMPI